MTDHAAQHGSGGGWFKVPNALVDRALADLSGGELKALLCVLRNMQAGGTAAVGMDYLAERAGMSRVGARKARDSAAQRGLITVHASAGGRGQRAVYRVGETLNPGNPFSEPSNSETGNPGNRLPQLPVTPERGNSSYQKRVTPVTPHKDTLIKTPQRVKPRALDPWAEASKHFTLGSPLDCDRFRTAWGEWAEHRRHLGKRLTPGAIKRQIVRCQAWGLDVAMAAIDRAISTGWRDLYPPDKMAVASPNGPNGPRIRTPADLYAAVRADKIRQARPPGRDWLDLTPATAYGEAGLKADGAVLLAAADIPRSDYR